MSEGQAALVAPDRRDPLEAAVRLENLIAGFRKGDLNSEQEDVLTLCAAVRKAVDEGAIYAHHGGSWALNDGACECECPRCWNSDLDGGTCLCVECTETAHGHPLPDERPQAGDQTDA